ncbi:hypothetical protein Csa_022969 [Cucumis sativus]|uniref:Uncharacterized protein n=1 Tax=Cucumis sativus TaxID=3659 RepID=A0A0A0KHU5_CUCSA|nr:hypothetical protein Csa_022969 [Cucumis sativus]
MYRKNEQSNLWRHKQEPQNSYALSFSSYDVCCYPAVMVHKNHQSQNEGEKVKKKAEGQRRRFAAAITVAYRLSSSSLFSIRAHNYDLSFSTGRLSDLLFRL